MLSAVGLIALGVALLYGGAEGLVRGSASIAGRLGLKPLAIGLTVVAFGTSMPELVVSTRAAFDGNTSIAVGGVVGSNIGNIALVLGLSALVRPVEVHANVIRIDVPILIGASALVSVMLALDCLGRLEGALLVVALLLYTGFSLRAAGSESPAVREQFAEGIPAPSISIARDLGAVAMGVVLLAIGARLLLSGAVTIAEALGIGQAVIGLTVVAVGTSLPELATSVVAAFKHAGDIAVGNIVGSCLFNLLGILGAAALVRPLAGGGMTAVDLTTMVALAVVLIPMMRSGFRISRGEGALLVAGYSVYIFHLVT